MEFTSVMKRRKTRLVVKRGIENIAIKVEDIACIYRNDQVIVVVDREEKKFLYTKTLQDLEQELDPALFFRANRRFIINMNYIQSYKPLDRVKLEVKLTLPSEQYAIVVSQETAPQFKKWFHEDEW